MPRVLVPVLPSERFLDSVVAAGDLVAQEGGIVTFLFTTVSPPPLSEEKAESQTESEVEVPPERGDSEQLDSWRDDMIHGLEDARQLLYDRGLRDDQIDHAFADYENPPAVAIADEAAAGGYDVVVLARGYFVNLPSVAGDSVEEIASEIQGLADEGVRLLVT